MSGMALAKWIGKEAGGNTAQDALTSEKENDTPTNKAIDAVANAAMDIGTGPAGIARGMMRASPAQAAVLDETKTAEYQQAQAAIQRGQGDQPTRGDTLWEALTHSGPTPKQTVQAAHQRQAQLDEALRRPGQPSVSEQRKLNDMNQFKLRAYQP